MKPYDNYLDAVRHCVRVGLDPLVAIVRLGYRRFEVRA